MAVKVGMIIWHGLAMSAERYARILQLERLAGMYAINIGEYQWADYDKEFRVKVFGQLDMDVYSEPKEIFPSAELTAKILLLAQAGALPTRRERFLRINNPGGH